MDMQEHLFGLVSEECHEIVLGASRLGQLASKINRFGLVAIDLVPGRPVYDNVEELIKEANDLIAIIETIGSHNLPGVDVSKLGDRAMIEKKKEKLHAYIRHSINLGRLRE
jgi:hypothetical protein